MSAPFHCPKCGRQCEHQYCIHCNSEFDADGLVNFDDTLVDTDDELPESDEQHEDSGND